MSLNDDLDVIQITLPTVPQDIAKLLEANGEFVDAVRGLISSLDNKREAAATLQEKVREALSGLQQSAEKQKTALEQALEATETAVNSMISTLDQARGEIEDQAEKAVAKVGELKSTLATSGDEAKTANEAASAKVGALEKVLSDDLQALATSVAAAEGAAEKLVGQIGTAGENAQEGVDTLKQKLDSIESLVPRYLDDTRTRRVEPPAGEMRDEVQEAMEPLATRNAQLFTGLSEATEEKGSDLLGVMGDVDTHGEGLGELVLAAQEDLPGDRGEIDPMIETLAEVREPLPGMVEAVKGAAKTANISW